MEDSGNHDSAPASKPAGVREFCKTPAYRAIIKCDREKLLRSLEVNPDLVHSREPRTGYTYLHVVVLAVAEPDRSESRLLPMIYQMSNAGVDVDATDAKERTALELSIMKNLPSIMVALLRIGSNQSLKDYSEIIKNYCGSNARNMQEMFDRYAPGLWTVVERGDLSRAYLLINSWCRINIHRDSTSLIEYVSNRNREYKSGRRNRAAEFESLLESFHVTLEFVHAVLAGDRKRMLALQMDECPCDADIMDISNFDEVGGSQAPRSLRQTAISMGLDDVIDLLPDGGRVELLNEDEQEEYDTEEPRISTAEVEGYNGRSRREPDTRSPEIWQNQPTTTSDSLQNQPTMSSNSLQNIRTGYDGIQTPQITPRTKKSKSKKKSSGSKDDSHIGNHIADEYNNGYADISHIATPRYGSNRTQTEQNEYVAPPVDEPKKSNRKKSSKQRVKKIQSTLCTIS